MQLARIGKHVGLENIDMIPRQREGESNRQRSLCSEPPGPGLTLCGSLYVRSAGAMPGVLERILVHISAGRLQSFFFFFSRWVPDKSQVSLVLVELVESELSNHLRCL